MIANTVPLSDGTGPITQPLPLVAVIRLIRQLPLRRKVGGTVKTTVTLGARAGRPRSQRQRCDVTPTCWHMSSTGHVEHFGRTPVQMCLPNGTSRALISIQ